MQILYDMIVLHSGGIHHSSDGWVSSTAEEEEEDIHPHRLLHLLHHRLLQHHTSNVSAHLSLSLCAQNNPCYKRVFKHSRGVCMSSSCSITTPPVGCAFSTSSSLKPYRYPGFTVGDNHHQISFSHYFITCGVIFLLMHARIVFLLLPQELKGSIRTLKTWLVTGRASGGSSAGCSSLRWSAW